MSILHIWNHLREFRKLSHKAIQIEFFHVLLEGIKKDANFIKEGRQQKIRKNWLWESRSNGDRINIYTNILFAIAHYSTLQQPNIKK